jgi:polar amino acid transport system substrate-binding protein
MALWLRDSRRWLPVWLILGAVVPHQAAAQGASRAPGVPSREATPSMTNPVAQRLAPGGELRVGLIGSNAVLITRAADGTLRGVAVELAGRLAQRLGVRLRMIPHENPGRYAESLSTDGWDLVLSGRDPLREEFVAFSEPYLEIESLYLARPGLGLDSAEQVDRPGIKVLVLKGGSQDNYLTRHLKQAALVRVEGKAELARQELASGRVDVFGGTAPGVYALAAEYPQAKVLAGRFSVVHQSVGVRRANADLLPYINEFLREAKAGGLVAEEIRRAGLKGVNPAP